ncbi:MAG: fumarylacetoacetate hydrolase family protein [Campylobacterales bacterium]
MRKRVVYRGREFNPPKVFCIGRNYVEHIEELNNKRASEPVVFMKPNISICEEERVLIPLEDVRFEGELSFLLKERRPIAVGFGIDFTAASVQERMKKNAHPWEKAKAFRNSAVFSEFVDFYSLEELELELYKNDILVQKGGVKEMIFDPFSCIDEVYKYFEIEEFDILMSGTPSGVGAVALGDVLEGRVLEGQKELVSKKWEIV